MKVHACVGVYIYEVFACVGMCI